MSRHPSGADAWAAQTIRGTAGLLAWTAAWVASVALSAYGPAALWSDQTAPTLIAIAVSVVLGVGMLFAHRHQLRTMDELQRKSQLETMALTLGVGLVGGVAWTLVARHDLVGVDAEIAHMVVLMGVVYMAGTVAGFLRYR